MSYPIEEIEGIGPAFREKLQEAGVTSTDDLLSLCASPKGRKDAAAKTGISEKMILGWTNTADLMRVSGIGKQFAELLEASGVDTIKELRTRNAENLAEAMKTFNEQKKLARKTPSSSQVADRIAEAKATDPKITY